MNIIIYEIRKRLLSTFAWIVLIVLFTWMSMAMFEAFADDSITAMFNNFPDAFKKAFGMDSDLSKILGYFGFIGVYIFLCGAIFACNLGLNAVSLEERDLTADFLISKPITRSKILSLKLAAALVHLLLYNLLIGLCCFAFVEAYKGGQEYSLEAFLLIFLGLFIFMLLFFSLGLFISVALRRMESSLPFSLGISFGLYILGSFDSLLDKTFLRYLIPYDYFEIQHIVENAAFKTYGLITSIALIALFTGAGYWLYRRRNIATAM